MKSKKMNFKIIKCLLNVVFVFSFYNCVDVHVSCCKPKTASTATLSPNSLLNPSTFASLKANGLTSTRRGSLTGNGKQCPVGFTGDDCSTECGVSYFEINTKIVGGAEAVPYSWPAHVLIVACYSGDFLLANLNVTVYQSACFMCGGTLIDRQNVLTAAHCILSQIKFQHKAPNGSIFTYSFPVWSNAYNPTNESIYTVYFGTSDISFLFTSDYTSNYMQMSARKVTRHENFDPVSYANDIALIRLSRAINVNRAVQVACLPQQPSNNYPSVNAVNWAIGWGTTSFQGSMSYQLKNVKLNIYDGARYCSNYKRVDWNTQICAGDIAGGMDTCQGDSGGGIYVLDQIGGRTKFVLAGITSYGNGCGAPGTAGIYTRISAYIDWINRQK